MILRLAAATSCVALMLLLAGCGDGRVRFKMAETSGRVMCDGKPVPYVAVFFEPLPIGEKKSIVGKQGMGMADENGAFTISTYDTNDGAVIGKHRVRVGPPMGEPRPGFTCDCVLNASVDADQVEVVGGQPNNFEIVLKPATKKQQLAAEKAMARDAENED